MLLILYIVSGGEKGDKGDRGDPGVPGTCAASCQPGQKGEPGIALPSATTQYRLSNEDIERIRNYPGIKVGCF